MFHCSAAYCSSRMQHTFPRSSKRFQSSNKDYQNWRAVLTIGISSRPPCCDSRIHLSWSRRGYWLQRSGVNLVQNVGGRPVQGVWGTEVSADERFGDPPQGHRWIQQQHLVVKRCLWSIDHRHGMEDHRRTNNGHFSLLLANMFLSLVAYDNL